jgi:hypothetical protein
MNPPASEPMVLDLGEHLQLCRQIFALAERESHVLRQPDGALGPEVHQKKNLLPLLNQSLNRIRQHRIDWQKRSAQDRARQTGIATLLGQIQDLIMKIIVLDRENEQALLRKGLIPARHLPSANRQRPHYVADLYRRQTDSAASSSVQPPRPS